MRWEGSAIGAMGAVSWGLQVPFLRLTYLSTVQNLALSSSSFTRDPNLRPFLPSKPFHSYRPIRGTKISRSSPYIASTTTPSSVFLGEFFDSGYLCDPRHGLDEAPIISIALETSAHGAPTGYHRMPFLSLPLILHDGLIPYINYGLRPVSCDPAILRPPGPDRPRPDTLPSRLSTNLLEAPIEGLIARVMDLSNLLTSKPSSSREQPTNGQPAAGAPHTSPNQTYSGAKLALDMSTIRRGSNMIAGSPIEPYAGTSAVSHSGSASPRQAAPPKSVQFELLFPHPGFRARLPLRVSIYPHDDTESIISTVKNFYGLYQGIAGISFEDDQSNTLIARYENFSNNMVVHVRVVEEPQAAAPFNSGAFQPGSVEYSAPQPGHHISRPGSRTSRKRSVSPNGNGARRSTSVSTTSAAKKGRVRVGKSHTSSYEDSVNGYSSGDGAAGSTSSKAKDHIGNTDISVDNIVEGGRRKRAKFESSELPLFAPPQMPAATSNPSVSPARRVEHQRPSIPFAHPTTHPFTNPRPLQSPRSYNGYSQPGVFATPVTDSRRHRASISYPSTGQGVLPTPDPTIGSCMSEEDKDVAIQLMRLGDMSNISHGRTSASTLDDTFSGRAEVASSTGATSNSASDAEDEMPPARRQKTEKVATAQKAHPTTGSHFVPPYENTEPSGEDASRISGDGDSSQGLLSGDADAKTQNLEKVRAPSAKPAKPKTAKGSKSGGAKTKRSNSVATGPMSPASLPAPSRKPSIASAMSGQPGDEEQPDLSTKPRCQRCRKSKKGCDRQRPCGRCRDAGLSADQCISEDEGNGRKGRYGRHMGVPIKAQDVPTHPTLLPAAPIAVPVAATDKSKKRKR
ncbi:hypothetical protein GGS20DRAFT_585291 [Poronia punctata]|nr:hypothetical protein GGS20DRAFT_585291 [Poronia punctata]